MASSYSTLLRLELQAAGENNDSWGDKANTVFQLLENAISKRQTLSVTASDVTLTTNNGADDQARSLTLAASGILTGNRSIIVPDLSKLYVVTNDCTGAFTLTVKTVAGSGIVVAQGGVAVLYCDGTNVISAASNAFSTIELGAGFTDTTLSRVSAGVLAVEGVNVLTTDSGAALASANVFTNANQTISAGVPAFWLSENDQAADEKEWAYRVNAKILNIRAFDDARSASSVVFTATRGTGTAISGIAIGNSTDLPPTTIWGPIELGHASDTTLTRVSAGVISVEGHTIPGVDQAATISAAWNFTTAPQVASLEIGHATDTTLTRVSAGIAAIEGKTIPVQESGTYVGTLTGMTTSPTTTVRYERVGTLVTIMIDTQTGTSNATTFTITGALPASVWASRTLYVALPIEGFLNNGSSAGVETKVLMTNANTTITIDKIGGWTASGQKGLSGPVCFSYSTA